MNADKLLDDPTMSEWLRNALRSALERDPVDAANDAELLRMLLHRRLEDAPDHADDAADPPRDVPPDSR